MPLKSLKRKTTLGRPTNRADHIKFLLGSQALLHRRRDLHERRRFCKATWCGLEVIVRKSHTYLLKCSCSSCSEAPKRASQHGSGQEWAHELVNSQHLLRAGYFLRQNSSLGPFGHLWGQAALVAVSRHASRSRQLQRRVRNARPHVHDASSNDFLLSFIGIGLPPRPGVMALHPDAILHKVAKRVPKHDHQNLLQIECCTCSPKYIAQHWVLHIILFMTKSEML